MSSEHVVREGAVRSYKLRSGRVGPTRAAALELLRPVHGLDLGDVADWAVGRRLVVEVGSGMGDTTAAMAAADPARDVLAVEVHTPGVGALLGLVEELGLTNVRVVEADAVHVLRLLAPASVQEVRVYFPDPWPKAKHHKRRLLATPFAELVASRLVPGGVLHVATDWQSYAEQAEAVLRTSYDVTLVDRPPHRPVTRFEQRGLDAGRASHDLVAVRRSI